MCAGPLAECLQADAASLAAQRTCCPMSDAASAVLAAAAHAMTNPETTYLQLHFCNLCICHQGVQQLLHLQWICRMFEQ